MKIFTLIMSQRNFHNITHKIVTKNRKKQEKEN